MSECRGKYQARHQASRKREPGCRSWKGLTLVLLGLLILAGSGTWVFRDTYSSNIAGTAEDIAINLVATKINASLRQGFYSDAMEGSLLQVERDGKGNIRYLEPNTKLINRLVMDFSAGVEENYSMDDLLSEKVNLGVVTGSKFLSQLPFTVEIRVQPLSLTKFECHTGFESQGINQTHYYVHCTVTSKVRILAPFTNQTAEICRTYQLAEAVVVGQVPDSYVVVPEEDILDVT